MSKFPGFLRSCLACLICILPLADAHAEDVTLSGVAFSLPDTGWERQEGSGSIILRRTWDRDEAAGRDEAGAALIQILPVTNATDFDASFDQLFGLFPELAEDDPLIDSEGRTVNGHDIRVELRCCTSQQDLTVSATLAGIATEGLGQYIMLIEMELHDEDSEVAEAAFSDIVRSVRFSSDEEAFALAPPEGAGGLEGIYTTLTSTLMPNVFGGLDFVAENRVLALDPGGLFSTVIPAGTIPDHCASAPTDCGTYRLLGGGVFSSADTIEMAEVANEYGILEVSREPFSGGKEQLVIGDTTYDRVPPLSAGTTFEGTWRFFWASSGMTATSSGGVSSERILTLTPDGRFSLTGSTGFMSSFDGADATTSVAGTGADPLRSGTYRVEGYELMLIGEDGQTVTQSLFLPEPGSDELLVIGGDNYLKEE